MIPCIEGEPFINTVPIETGLTNAVIKNDGSRVVGLNSENSELYEGMMIDFLLHVRSERVGYETVIIPKWIFTKKK